MRASHEEKVRLKELQQKKAMKKQEMQEWAKQVWQTKEAQMKINLQFKLQKQREDEEEMIMASQVVKKKSLIE